MHVLILEGQGEPARFALDAPAKAGGSKADGIHVPGLAPSALRLEPCPAGVVVVPSVPGAHVAGHPVSPGARRLARPGERIEVGGAVLALTGAPAESTRAAAGALLLGADHAGPSLVVLSGPEAGKRHLLQGEVVLGRGRAAGLRLPDVQTSRRHARVRLRGERAEILDLGSKNGVRVNGVRVERRPVPLSPGDEIALGETILAFEHPSAPGSRPEARPRRHRLPPAVAAAALLALSAAALLLAGS